MTLAERLSESVRACFTGIWIQSHEHDDALLEIGRLCRAQNWTCASWDLDRGLTVHGGTVRAEGATNPLAAIRAVRSLAPAGGAGILVSRNYHKFLGSPEIIQALDIQLAAGKQDRTCVVILAPVVQVPIELERRFVVFEHTARSRVVGLDRPRDRH